MEEILQRSVGPCKQAITDAGVKASEIDEVILVGGSTRIPRVQQIVRELFGKEPHRGVNPDEVVAVGAAVQAGVLSGEVKDILLLDVTPLSLGIETLGHVATKLIPRNTTIPTRKSEIFTTAGDNQTEVEIHVVQGEREMAYDNRTLGRFNLVGIPAAPRGVPQVEVTFDIDANGIVNVSAKDLGTGKEQRITITSSSGLNKDEVDKMVKEAESHSDEDRKKKEEIEVRNRADSMIYNTEKLLKENREKLPEAEAHNIETAIEACKKAVESGKREDIEARLNELTSASHKLAEVLYKNTSAGQTGGAGQEQQQQQEQGPAGSDPGAAESDGVIDAEYEDVKL
jgi:molecular chaperone DnaK